MYLNFNKMAKEKGWEAVTIKMVRVPVYASTQPTVGKETTQKAYINPERINEDSVVVCWKGVMGRMGGYKDGCYTVIHTERAKYEIIEINSGH